MALSLGLVVLMTALSGRAAAEQKPLILIFAPDCPDYAHEIERIIQQIDGIQADTDVIESADAFRLLLFLPRVKLIVVVLSHDKNYQIGSLLEWFFDQGGGLLGIGFAASEKSVGNASREVFPIFGNNYRTGSYDRASKSFLMQHIKEEDDEISEGLGDFVAQDQKIILSFSVKNNSYAPRYPSKGEYKVLYREKTTGAPSIVKYEDNGVSVTFACFAGEDIERAVDYYGRFTGSPEFRKLLSNAVLWLWRNEKKYEASLQDSQAFYSSMDEHKKAVRDAALKRHRAEAASKVLRIALTIVLAVASIAVVYRFTFATAR